METTTYQEEGRLNACVAIIHFEQVKRLRCDVQHVVFWSRPLNYIQSILTEADVLSEEM